MSDHTPEPWIGVDKDGRFCPDHDWSAEDKNADCSSSAPIFADGMVVALVVATGEDTTELKANARRIVAAVNFCKGVSTENLERNNPLMWLVEKYNEAVSLRTEMLKALKQVQEDLNNGDDSIMADTAVFVDSVISKAEAEQ